MERQKVFPTVMLGFQKKVVLDYIYSQDVAAKAREQELQKEVEAKEARLAELQGMVEELTSQQEILSAQLYSEKEEHMARKASFDKMKSDADQLVQLARNKDNELQIQLELNKQLQNKSADQENKIKLLLARLEQLELQQAQNPAEQVVAQAAAEAEFILGNARRQAKEMVDSAAATARHMAAEEADKLRVEFAGLRQNILDKLDAFTGSLSTLGQQQEAKPAEFPVQEEQPPAGEADAPTQDHFFR